MKDGFTPLNRFWQLNISKFIYLFPSPLHVCSFIKIRIFGFAMFPCETAGPIRSLRSRKAGISVGMSASRRGDLNCVTSSNSGDYRCTMLSEPRSIDRVANSWQACSAISRLCRLTALSCSRRERVMPPSKISRTARSRVTPAEVLSEDVLTPCLRSSRRRKHRRVHARSSGCELR